MGRRRRGRKKSGAEELIELPWQVSAVLAVASFSVIRWVAPSFFSGPLLAGLTPVFTKMSWVALAAFGFLAVLAFVRAKTQAGLPAPKGRLKPAAPPQSPWPAEPSPAPGAPSACSHLQAQKASEEAPVKAWSVEALQMLEWKRFELLCARYYAAIGFQTETLPCGADGGIDIKLFKIDPCRPLAVVQCKAWAKRPVGVKEIRELLGVLAHEKVARGIFITTGSYTHDAIAFGTANPIQLLDGPGFVKKMMELGLEKQKALLEFAFAGDYRTPTCPSCGVKLLGRDGKRGKFWGCMHYPKCRYTLPLHA